jgi:hypothetical protein
METVLAENPLALATSRIVTAVFESLRATLPPLNLGHLLKASIDGIPAFSKLFSWIVKINVCFIETFLYNLAVFRPLPWRRPAQA